MSQSPSDPYPSSAPGPRPQAQADVASAPSDRSLPVGPAAHGGTALLVVLCAAQAMLVIDVSVTNVALPAIQADLQVATAQLQWTATAYTLAFGGLLLLFGRAGDLFGRRRLFLVGLALFTAASLACGLAPEPWLLFAARAVQGVGAAMVSPAALALLTTSFAEGPARNRAIGIWGAVAGGGAVLGVLLGGVIVEYTSWRWVFLVNIPLGLAVLAAGARLLPTTHPQARPRMDAVGSLTLTGGLVALVYALTQAATAGLTSTAVLAAAAAGVALLGVFVVVELRHPEPLVPLTIFTNRSLTGANAISGLIVACAAGMLFFSSLYLQQVLGYSALATGAAFVPVTVIIMIASTRVPRLLVRVGGPRPLLITGALLLTAGVTALSFLSPGGSYATDVLPGLLLIAAGNGLMFTSAVITATSGVAPEQQGLASGLLNTAQQLGGALGLAVLAALASAQTDTVARAGGALSPGPEALVAGYRYGLRGAIAFGLLALLLAVFVIPRRPGTRRTHTARAASASAAAAGIPAPPTATAALQEPTALDSTTAPRSSSAGPGTVQ